MEKIAIYAGSFDPITMGHINLIQKASKKKIIINQEEYLEVYLNLIKVSL